MGYFVCLFINFISYSIEDWIVLMFVLPNRHYERSSVKLPDIRKTEITFELAKQAHALNTCGISVSRHKSFHHSRSS